jgi:LPS-assembly protein
VDYDIAAGTATATNGIYVQYTDPVYGSAVMTADTATVDTKTGVVFGDGHVRIESGDLLWLGDHITYNFKTRQMTSEQFRTGKPPVLASGTSLTGNASNSVYAANHAFVTTDDISDPMFKVHASRIVIIPHKSIQMYNAVATVDGVPVFYFPYYHRSLGEHSDHFDIKPGYRSIYGPYFLSTYTWYLGDYADGKIHGDYLMKRGPGFGPDVNLHLGRWGDGSIKYYYIHDNRSNYSTNSLPFFGNIPENRQRFYLGWQATPATNFNVKALVNYQSDPLVLHDFFEGDYTVNPQPNTFVEANKYWDNWSLDALTTPRVNSFFSQIEREPDVKLTGFRQQLFGTPIYYESESSIGWYRSFMANMTNGFYPATNGFYVDSATRADTYHQLTVPWTFFNFLNVTPRVGGRLTYYSSRGGTNFNNLSVQGETYREVFNTGIGASFKATALWEDAKSSLFDVDGLRHIIEPSVNYVFVPDPSTPPNQLPQFDAEQPALLIAPITFPDYNSIDSIDTMNVIRFGLRNVLQTKRDGSLDDVVNWNLMLDWRLDPKAGQSDFNDLYSQLAIRPRSWLTFESQIRYALEQGNLNLAFHQVTFTPNNRWSWSLSHWYLRAGFLSPIQNDFIGSTIYYRLDDNWGIRANHNFDIESGRLQQQYYTLYRDMRSWTAALTFQVTDNVNSSPDFTISFAFSLKASPATGVGDDIINPYRLVGE